MATTLSDSSGNARTSHTRAPENDSASLGELLRRAREGRGLTLEQIAKETRIPQHHLEALEHDNLTAVPGGFYRRAEVRAFAQAVNLDANFALAQLQRALEWPAAREAVPATPGTRKPTPSRKGVLIAIGFAVAAAVFGLAMGGREPALDRDAEGGSPSNSAQNRTPPVRETPPDFAGTSQRTQLEPVAVPSAESALAVTREPAGTRASAATNDDDDLAKKTEQAEGRASEDTELVVTTQPEGARITVNGIGWGSAPVTIRYLSAGNKRIRVAKEGYVTEERVVRLAEGHVTTLDIPLRSAR